ncbi:MAG: helix-turn-helix transcriptional regulator [Vulcanimicrobiaceae bacterium]
MERRRGWTFLSNHAHVVIALAKNTNSTVRELADTVGITERAVTQILGDLEEAGILTRRRLGRRNVYDIDPDAHLRHDVEAHRTVGDLLRLAQPTVVKQSKPFGSAKQR